MNNRITLTDEQYASLDNSALALTHITDINAGDYIFFCDEEWWEKPYISNEKTWFRKYFLFKVLSVSTRSLFINYQGYKVRYPRALPLQPAPSREELPREIRDASFTHVISQDALHRVLGKAPTAREYYLKAPRHIPCSCCKNMTHKTIDFIVMPYCPSCFEKAAEEWNASIREMAKKLDVQVTVEE
jgi:hypothetical protein